MSPWIVALVFLAVLTPALHQHALEKGQVDMWASRIGYELWHFGDFVTRRNRMQESCKDVKVEKRDGMMLAQSIARDIRTMMDLKISAVKRILDTAENSAMAQQAEPVEKDYQFYNAKKLVPPGEGAGKPNGTHELLLIPNVRFNNVPVNTSVSTVHVPTSVYDRSPEVLQGIKWSSNLDEIFIDNYKRDPTLSWQYFGSSTGFMRQFPGMEWKQEPVDLYDCRMRSWYIEASTSSKDMVILVDNSGSMTGQKSEIAKHVVGNILDTLGSNDFVNVLKFENVSSEVVPCFQSLVQANLANVRELKLGLKNMGDPSNIANFTTALTRAFELLKMTEEQREGACCNQAIMLVTDGVPYNYKEIFEEYNWKNLPTIPVRMFTYLIGREVPDTREIKWMACINQGYYTHLSTLAEVREKILHYISVMARPLVLGRTLHPIIWTQVYADIADPKMTEWLWEMKEREEQKEKTLRSIGPAGPHSHPPHPAKKKRVRSEYDTYPYKMMTSVSMPVFDRREVGTKIANLLGVAGTDIPNSDIQRHMVKHLLGVNAYAFIVTNNGYVILHPDLRPVFQGILKPSYNSIDISEVELYNDDSDARSFNNHLLKLRQELIDQANGSVTLNVKYHYDGLRRVSLMKRHYYYSAIHGTPFELVVALPDDYGQFRVSTSFEIQRWRTNNSKGNKKILDFFSGNWTINPDWWYCRYHVRHTDDYKSAKEELEHFLNKSIQQGWKWPLSHTSPPENQCDRQLFQNLVADAKNTEWFSEDLTRTSVDEKAEDRSKRFGLTMVFLATHTGLTRWQDIEDTPSLVHFSEVHNKATEEIWYRRAVEFHSISSESFVFSVPFNAGDANDTLVTASHAVFCQKAPAAVIGMQFRHSALHSFFIQKTSSCAVNMPEEPCSSTTCNSSDVECYLLDNNGYIIVAKSLKHTGMFFGEVEGGIMSLLIEDGVYIRIRVFDYQAVCLENENSQPSNSCKIITPVKFLGWILQWIFSQIVWLISQTQFNWISVYSFTTDDRGEGEASLPPVEFKSRVMINKTQPQPCDMEVYLYQLSERELPDKEKEDPRPDRCLGHPINPYIARKVPNTNLVIVTVNKICGIQNIKFDVKPIKVDYNNSVACFKYEQQPLSRRRPKDCIKSHLKEQDLDDCGFGTRLLADSSLIFFLILYSLRYLFNNS